MNISWTIDSLNASRFLFLANMAIDIDEKYDEIRKSKIIVPIYGTSKFNPLIKTQKLINKVTFKISQRSGKRKCSTTDKRLIERSLSERGLYFNQRLQSLSFFKRLGVIKSYKYSSDFIDDNALLFIQIIPSKFQDVKKILRKIYIGKHAQSYPVANGCFLDQLNPAKSKKPADTILYEITLTPDNRICINGHAISKPNYDGENADVIRYLMGNPNKDVSKAEIKRKTGKSVGKDFHKIVENLGFTGPLKKTFFNVSNDTIHFRNPITKTIFDGLGLPPLKLLKK